MIVFAVSTMKYLFIYRQILHIYQLIHMDTLFFIFFLANSGAYQFTKVVKGGQIHGSSGSSGSHGMSGSSGSSGRSGSKGGTGQDGGNGL